MYCFLSSQWFLLLENISARQLSGREQYARACSHFINCAMYTPVSKQPTRGKTHPYIYSKLRKLRHARTLPDAFRKMLLPGFVAQAVWGRFHERGQKQSLQTHTWSFFIVLLLYINNRQTHTQNHSRCGHFNTKKNANDAKWFLACNYWETSLSAI